MEIAELATLIALLCGKGETDKTLDCRDLMVNCSVGPGGVIKPEKVEECKERARREYGNTF